VNTIYQTLNKKGIDMKSLFRLVLTTTLVSMLFCPIAKADFSDFLKNGDTNYYPGGCRSANDVKDARQIAKVYSPAEEAGPKNLVVNGDFEQPVIYSYYLIELSPPGWDGIGDFVQQGYSEAIHSGNGNQWFDLNPGMSKSTGISQIIYLTAGITYSFSFFYNGGGGGSTKEISYSLDSNSGTLLSGVVSTAGMDVYHGTPWKTFSAILVPTFSGPYKLSFVPNGSISGGFIDGIILLPVEDLQLTVGKEN
jgi:hypothetical protein